MGLLDSIEKLITEHGSAAILRERIALANDKHAALEKRAASLESENVALKSQLQSAKSVAVCLRNELAKLGQKEQPAGPTVRLEDMRERILVLLSASEGLAEQQVAQAVGVGQQVARFHLQELQAAGMVRGLPRVGQSSTEWRLNPTGTQYLVVTGLVA